MVQRGFRGSAEAVVRQYRSGAEAVQKWCKFSAEMLETHTKTFYLNKFLDPFLLDQEGGEVEEGVIQTKI